MNWILLAIAGLCDAVLTGVNDYLIRISVMTEAYCWHYHSNSDETFIAIEGIIIIEMENQVVELGPGQMFTVPRNVRHKTRPKELRSVNQTIEHKETATVLT